MPNYVSGSVIFVDTTGSVWTGRARLRGLVVSAPSGGPGTLTLRDGADGTAPALFTFTVPAGSYQWVGLAIPFDRGIFAEITAGGTAFLYLA